MQKRCIQTIDRLAAGEVLSSDDIAKVIACDDAEVVSYLYQKADHVRKAHDQNRVYIRAIIEFSSHCRCDCHYCGLRRENTSLARYRMTPDEIVQTAQEAAKAGYRTIILQSGEDMYYTCEMLGDIVRRIRAATPMVITLSAGERPEKDYAYFKECGADRYLLKHETSDEALYNQYHSHSSFQNRIRCLEVLSRLGYEVGSGFMVGLPSATAVTLANDLLLLRRLNVKMAGIGPYISHPLTPLGGSPDGDADVTLRVLALARLLLPESYLPATTALNVKGGLTNALSCGANVIMQKATPFDRRDLYDIYPGRESAKKELKQQRDELAAQLIAMGRQPI